MADETNVIIETPAETPDTPNPAGQTPGGTEPTFTQAQLNAFLAEERRKLQNSEDARKGRDAQKRLAELEAEKLSESEKLSRRAAEAEAERDRIAKSARDARIEAAFTVAAVAEGIPADRIPFLYRAADLGGVEVNDDGKVTGLSAAIKALPEFVRVATKAAPDLNGGNGANAPIDKETRIAEARREMQSSGNYARL